jgi:hypothetical protein
MEETERKNNGENQPMTPRSRSQGFLSLRGEIGWWSCGYRSPLSYPSKRCTNHGSDSEKSRFWWREMEVYLHAQEP